MVFLDLRMPGLSGFEVLALLAAEPALERIPVIIFTSQSLSDAERQRLERARAILDKAKLSEEGEPTLREALALAGIPNHVEPQRMTTRHAHRDPRAPRAPGIDPGRR